MHAITEDLQGINPHTKRVRRRSLRAWPIDYPGQAHPLSKNAYKVQLARVAVKRALLQAEHSPRKNGGKLPVCH